MSVYLRRPLYNFLSTTKSFIDPSPLKCRSFSTTHVLLAQPPKKKRRIDPAVLRVRVERKIGKHEREIAKLENEPKQSIPILEYEYSNSEIRDLKSRPGRTFEDVGLTQGSIRAAQRLWNFYRFKQSRMESNSVKRVERAQTRALETLRQLDEALYERTVTVDDITLIPCTSSQIRKETLPDPNYRPPDGNIKDVTKEWVM